MDATKEQAPTRRSSRRRGGAELDTHTLAPASTVASAGSAADSATSTPSAKTSPVRKSARNTKPTWKVDTTLNTTSTVPGPATIATSTLEKKKKRAAEVKSKKDAKGKTKKSEFKVKEEEGPEPELGCTEKAVTRTPKSRRARIITTKTKSTTKVTKTIKTAKIAKTTRMTKKAKEASTSESSETHTGRAKKRKAGSDAELDVEEKEEDGHLGGDEAVKPKSKRVKRKLSTQVETEPAEEDSFKDSGKMDVDGDTAAPSQVKAKRIRKKRAEAGGNVGEERRDGSMTLQAAAPRNPSDPCSVLPSETWNLVLSYLPLSLVAQISIVSKTWLDGSRGFPAWKFICEKQRLGSPKVKYRSHLALVCSQSYFICDLCGSNSMNRSGSTARIPLPVARQDDDGKVWNLCWDCRTAYYLDFPEEMGDNYWGFTDDEQEPTASDFFEQGEMTQITRTLARTHYALTMEDLNGLRFTARRNPHYRNAPPMCLYNRLEVKAKARAVHAGVVGVRAARKGVARIRAAACRERDRGFMGHAKAPSKKVMESTAAGKTDNKKTKGRNSAPTTNATNATAAVSTKSTTTSSKAATRQPHGTG